MRISCPYRSPSKPSRNVSTDTASPSVTVGRVPTLVTPWYIRPSGRYTQVTYTPWAGASTCSGTARFTVGIPMVRPMR